MALLALARAVLPLLCLASAEDLKLQHAVREGDAAAVHALRQQLPTPPGYSYDAEDGFGRSPLHEAVEFGHLAVVEEILKWPGVDQLLNVPDELGWTALHWAALKGTERIAELLLRQRASVDVKENEFACEPLQWAARRGHVPLIRLLLSAGANASYQDKENRTAADWAHTTNRMKAYALLAGTVLAEGEEPQQESHNFTRLHAAALLNRGEALRQLLATPEGRAMAAQKDAWGRTPLLTMIQANYLVPDGEDAVLQLLPLLQDIPAAFAADPDGRNPLHWAVLTGFHDLVEALQNLPQEPDKWGRHLIHLAAAAGHEFVLERLLDKKADVKAKDQSHRTALHLAASIGTGLELLFKRRADVGAMDLLQRQPLHYAVLLGRSDAVNQLIQAGANLAARDMDNLSPLSFMAGGGSG